MNVAWRAPSSLRVCTFRQRAPLRICSTTASPGDASGLLAVSMSDCPPGPPRMLATLADTGGMTITSTGRLSAPCGPASRNPAFLVRSETVTSARPSVPVVAEPTGCQDGSPARRSCKLRLAPATARPWPVSWPVNVSLPPATIRPLATVTDRACGPAGSGTPGEGALARGEAAAEGCCAAPGACDALWPPLLTGLTPKAGNGISKKLFGTFRRQDGTLQVTFNGHPMYFFAFDLGVTSPNGATNGEHILDPAPVNGVWYTTLPTGLPEPGTATIQSEMVTVKGASVNVLADAGAVNGLIATLYTFSTDTATTSTCNGLCAIFWPPVLTQTAPAAMGSVNGSLLGAIQRSDGTFQVTYNGHPLYYFALALTTGSTAGNGVMAFGGTFNTVNVSGAVG